jgi:hypothetical protein
MAITVLPTQWLDKLSDDDLTLAQAVAAAGCADLGPDHIEGVCAELAASGRWDHDPTRTVERYRRRIKLDADEAAAIAKTAASTHPPALRGDHRRTRPPWLAAPQRNGLATRRRRQRRHHQAAGIPAHPLTHPRPRHVNRRRRWCRRPDSSRVAKRPLLGQRQAVRPRPWALGSASILVRKFVDLPEADRPAADRPAHTPSTGSADREVVAFERLL